MINIQFITAYTLKHPEEKIPFAAKINFNTNGHSRKDYCDINIINIANLNIVYLLNTNLFREEFRDIFKSLRNGFHFIKDQQLLMNTN